VPCGTKNHNQCAQVSTTVKTRRDPRDVTAPAAGATPGRLAEAERAVDEHRVADADALPQTLRVVVRHLVHRDIRPHVQAGTSPHPAAREPRDRDAQRDRRGVRGDRNEGRLEGARAGGGSGAPRRRGRRRPHAAGPECHGVGPRRAHRRRRPRSGAPFRGRTCGTIQQRAAVRPASVRPTARAPSPSVSGPWCEM